MTLRRRSHAAFTLIELLTVMAISAILLTLILLPVFQSFNLTRQAQALAEAQDKGRVLTERIAREIGDAVAVREGARVIVPLNGGTANLSGNSVVVRVPSVTPGPAGGRFITPRQDVEVVLPNSKLDLALPAQGDPTSRINPATGKEDPTLEAPTGQINYPVAPGQTIRRYFVALRNPFLPYNNPYDGLLSARNGERDNLFVLYRAEVQPYRFIQDPDSPAGQTPPRMIRVVDDRYFATLPNGAAQLDDPRFVTPFNPDGTPDAARAARLRNWLASATIQTEISRFDMVQTLYDLASRRVLNDGGVPRVLPLIQFRPTRVGSEPVEGQVAVRPGEETGSGAASAPDVFLTRLALLSNVAVRTWPSGFDRSNPNADEYLVGRPNPALGPSSFSIFAFDPAVGGFDMLSGTELFDLRAYNDTLVAQGRFPFTAAVDEANARSGWLANANLRALFVPYRLDTQRGKLVTSFGIDEVGNSDSPVDVDNPDNLPTVPTAGADDVAYTPRNAPPAQLAANLQDIADVNGRFNKIFSTWENDAANTTGIRNLDAGRIQRYVDLRVARQGDGSRGPLDPTLGLRRASVVPGSEVVIGPDQTPLNYGQPVRYVRVSGTPGPNQYRMVYTDQPEPANYALIGLTGPALSGFDPNVYDPSNVVSAVVQPQYKAGYVQLNSDPNQPLPPGRIRVSYRFQFTTQRTGLAAGAGTGAPRDAFAVDYDSRELMSVLLTIRAYPQSSAPNPQNVTLEATSRVRNYAR